MTRPNYLTRDPEILAALQVVNDGTAYFARTLAALPDTHLSAATLLPGWTRRQVIAHLSYNAQALSRLVTWAATGIENQMYKSPEAREAQINEGAHLAPHDLRALFSESATALDTSWQQLTDDAWSTHVWTSPGAPFPTTTTIWMRTREVWLHAVDLDSGATFVDFPHSLVDRLLRDVLAAWRRGQADESIPNFVLAPIDRGAAMGVGDPADSNATYLRGTAVDLARWATGRSTLGITVDSGEPVPSAPRWI